MFEKKEGQVTVFIIVAVLIVAGVVLYFVLSDDSSENKNLGPGVEKVNSYVQNCLEDVSEEVAYRVSERGGYYYPPENSTFLGTPYYFKDGHDLMPSKEEVESEISIYTEGNMLFCLDGFSDFESHNISAGEIEANTKISKEKLKVSLDFPITGEISGSSYRLRDFDSDLPIRMGTIHNAIKKFQEEDVKMSSNGSALYCMSCLNRIAGSRGLRADAYSKRLDNDTTVFVFQDPNSKLNNRSLRWTFANDY